MRKHCGLRSEEHTGDHRDSHGRCLGNCRECEAHLMSDGRNTVYCPSCDLCPECEGIFDHTSDCTLSPHADIFMDEETKNSLQDQGFIVNNDGRIICNSCSASVINGVPCHEHGCPDRRVWVECCQCDGGEYLSRHVRFFTCKDCHDDVF